MSLTVPLIEGVSCRSIERNSARGPNAAPARHRDLAALNCMVPKNLTPIEAELEYVRR